MFVHIFYSNSCADCSCANIQFTGSPQLSSFVIYFSSNYMSCDVCLTRYESLMKIGGNFQFEFKNMTKSCAT